jgi:hypothetical protein
MITDPDFLYKYRSLEGSGALYLKRLLLHDEIYFASRKAFNDPFECRPKFSFDGSKQQLRRYAKRVLTGDPNLTSARRKSLISQIVRDRRTRLATDAETLAAEWGEMLDRDIGIYCLSARPNDLLMWSHYADSHRGVCVRFDRCQDPLLKNVMRVNYQTEYPVMRPLIDRGVATARRVFLTKSDHWGYEEEWRIVDMSRGPGIRRIVPSAISGIILGARISDSDREKVLTWIQERSCFVEIIQARLGEFRYEVVCNEVVSP